MPLLNCSLLQVRD